MAAMQKPDNAEFARIQTRIAETAERLLSDGAFARQYKADPPGALKAQGLPDEAVQSLLAQARGEDEVGGYMMNESYTWGGYSPGQFNPDHFHVGEDSSASGPQY